MTTVSGTEDFTARLYVNDRNDEVMIVDYFRRMRRWRNELYRVGIRLTYDVVLPDPGRRLRERWLEVGAIDQQLATPFNFAIGAAATPYTSILAAERVSAYSTTFFNTLTFDEMGYDTLNGIARSYGTTIPPSPDVLEAVEEQHSVVEPATRNDVYSFSLTLPATSGYHVQMLVVGGVTAAPEQDGMRITAEYWGQTLEIPSDGQFRSKTFNLPQHAPERIVIGCMAFKGAVGEVRARAEIVPTAEAWRQWRSNVWSIIRQAAYARDNEKREVLRQRRAALLKELEATDAVILRRMEREQVMHLVLQWLFPDFSKAGAIYRDAANAKPESWQPAMEYGEYIKFVHEAIDWDRALIILHPYFWDNPDNHAIKLYLDHPNAQHREFLRAGAARVVIAIKPGFEEEVVSLLDKGELGKLAPQSRFMPIVEKVQEANARFVSLLAGEFDLPEDGDPAPASAVPGDLVGRWHDWTPTAALDIDVRIRKVIQEV